MIPAGVKTEFYPGNDELIVFIGDEDVMKVRENLNASLLFVSGFDWNDALSPWPADPVFGKVPFGGHADDLAEYILSLGVMQKEWKKMYAVGYSLAGLFVLYLCTKTDRFDGAASCSGSLWFDRFMEYLEGNKVQCEKIYLSLGDRESNTKNPRMKTVEECTKKAEKIFSAYSECIYESNPGNHFQDPEGRIRKGIDWLLR